MAGLMVTVDKMGIELFVIVMLVEPVCEPPFSDATTCTTTVPAWLPAVITVDC